MLAEMPGVEVLDAVLTAWVHSSVHTALSMSQGWARKTRRVTHIHGCQGFSSVGGGLQRGGGESWDWGRSEREVMEPGMKMEPTQWTGAKQRKRVGSDNQD